MISNEQTACFTDLLTAAEGLLEARENQMITSVEWQRLRAAVDAARAQVPRSWSVRVDGREVCHLVGPETEAQANAVAACRQFRDQPVDIYEGDAHVARYWRGVRRHVTWVPD